MKTIIVEDERINQLALKDMLENLPVPINIISIAENVTAAVNDINELKPELVFMDIKIIGGSGFDVLERIEYQNFSLIFTTAYDNYALKAFEYSAIDYLLKPIEERQLENAIERAKTRKAGQNKSLDILLKNLQQNKAQKIGIPTLDEIVFIDIEKIIRLEADSNYTLLKTSEGNSFIISRSLKYYEDLLRENGFIRIHDKHLINIDYVSKYIKGQGGQVVLTDKTVLDVSRRRKNELMESLQKRFIL